MFTKLALALISVAAVAAIIVIVRPRLPAGTSIPADSNLQMKVEASPNDPQPTIGAEPSILVPTRLYVTKYENNDALFVLNSIESSYYENGEKKIDPNRGTLYYRQNGIRFGMQRILADLDAPRLIYEDSTGSPYDARDVFFSADRQSVYIVLNHTLTDASAVSGRQDELVRIYLSTLKKEKLWSHSVGDKKYGDYLASAFLESVAEPYAALSIGSCDQCGGEAPRGIVIVNTSTGKEIQLGPVGDLAFDLSGKVARYSTEGKPGSVNLP